MAQQSDIRSFSAKVKDQEKGPAESKTEAKPKKEYDTVWYDVPRSVRRCEDGGHHNGDIEIVTWDALDDGQDMGPRGWGASVDDEGPELKEKFEVEMKGDLAAFYEYWPQGFRWTCCGLPGDYKWGCDSHFPDCRCDNCRFGYKLPEGFVEERNKSAHAQGLKLGEGNVNGKTFEDSD